jgi:3-dehydroquinate synthase
LHIDSISIKSNIGSYSVCFCSDNQFIKDLSVLGNSIFIIDENVWNLHKNTSLASLINCDNIILPVNEEKKNLESVQDLYSQIMKRSPKRNLNIISIGGGIIQDITGFVASTLYRGVNWIYIPTTLLAQADSCIGAKTSLNYENYKNLIGTFFPPSKVFIYPEFLKTLDLQDYYSGVGEIAKLKLIAGKSQSFDFIDSIDKIACIDSKTVLRLIKESLNIKKEFIEEDEFDTGRRNLLNFGHCFGHAIESSTNFLIPHGQAVSLGIIAANITAKNKGFLDQIIEEFIRTKMLLPILKADISVIDFNDEKIIAAMSKDKKNTGNGLALIMMNNDYQTFKITDLSKQEAIEALQETKKLLGNTL